MTEKKQEVQVIKETATTPSPAQAIMQAVQSGTDLAQLEKVLELQIKWEGNEARKAYHVAMSAFKANPPKIVKDKQVSFSTSKGQTSYKHATLANVTESISKALSEHGLSATWSTKQNGGITVTCKITHVLGHSEETSLTGQPDATGSKNSIQQIGSTITYLERYTLLALTGLATSEDDDGKGTEDVELISEKQLSVISDYLDNNEDLKTRFLAHFKIQSVSELPARRYNQAIIALKAKGGTK